MTDDLQRSLGRVEGKIDQFMVMMKDHFKDDERQFGAIDKRLLQVERRQWWASGVAAAIGFMLAKLSALSAIFGR